METESREDRIRRLKREWYHRNKDKVLAQQNNPQKKAYYKRWYQENRAYNIERVRTWEKENPHQVALTKQRAKQKELGEWHYPNKK
jgi:hypothetical protein